MHSVSLSWLRRLNWRLYLTVPDQTLVALELATMDFGALELPLQTQTIEDQGIKQIGHKPQDVHTEFIVFGSTITACGSRVT